MRFENRRGALTMMLATAAALLAHVPGAAAQQGVDGPRWQAWFGCWQASASAAAPTDAATSSELLCVVPSESPGAAEFLTVVDGSIESRSLVRADGAPQDAAREGCSGWERAEWAAGGSRLYLDSEFRCDGGVERRSSGMMAFASNGDWIDVQSVASGANSGVHVVRYRAATDGAAIPDEVAAAIGNRSLARSTARLAAVDRIDPEVVVEVSRRLDERAVEAWLLERGQSFTVDAASLTRLADGGVSDRVIDLLVAMSYPEVFAIDDADDRRAAPMGPRGPVWDPWYGPSYRGFYPYGGRYGGYYGGYPGVVVVRQPSGSGGNGGQAVKGEGYRRGNGGGDRAQPSTRPSSDGAATRAPSGGSRGSSGGATRTARPKD